MTTRVHLHKKYKFIYFFFKKKEEKKEKKNWQARGGRAAHPLPTFFLFVFF
jgi:hypothetical protein